MTSTFLFSSFNSIKVRLKPVCLLPVSSPSAFQFHKGAIETAGGARKDIRERPFNSIKVRLKPRRSLLTRQVRNFQFHKGAIETVVTSPKKYKKTNFQFHKGAIETPMLEEGEEYNGLSIP